MVNEYTPTTDQVRRYWQYGANAWADEVARDDDTQADGTSIGAEFDRWMNQVKAEVWDEAVALLNRWNSVSLADDLEHANPYRSRSAEAL